MKKSIIIISLALLTGFLLSQVFYRQYDAKQSLIPTFQNSKKVYFMEQGVYEDKAHMEQGTLQLPHFIYREQEGKFYVYLGMTQEEKNISKLKGYLEKQGYTIHVKEFSMTSSFFIDALEQYDILLSKTEEEGTIQTICTQVLDKYEEWISEDEYQNQGSAQM